MLLLFLVPVVTLAKDNAIDMIWIKPGTFLMGSAEKSFRDAQPCHQVKVDGFWIDKTEVTNEQFASFVKETGYKTVAERTPKAEDFPGAPPENLVPGSLVFTPPKKPVGRNHFNWWRYVPGANWQHPEGPKSNLKGLAKYPVVQIAYEDAEAYAKWAGKRLPTEAEFEYAARGGLEGKKYSWGDELVPQGKWQANIWQGVFPYKNSKEDGFSGTSPVAYFPANGYGLYDMTGNVWEWCSDFYVDAREPKAIKRVQKGGSFLCTDQYCARYMVGARGKGEVSSGCSNVGFRCVTSEALR